MEKISLEMPLVASCGAIHCGYNVGSKCHAKAITVGDYITPGCDTFFESDLHNKETKRNAGVGACKVSICKYNNDFECTAENVSVGFFDQIINCTTFTER